MDAESESELAGEGGGGGVNCPVKGVINYQKRLTLLVLEKGAEVVQAAARSAEEGGISTTQRGSCV